MKNVGPIRHCEPPHAACFTLPFTRCRYCRTPPAHRCPQQRRQQRQRVTEGTAMAPWNGPNNSLCGKCLERTLRSGRTERSRTCRVARCPRQSRDARWHASRTHRNQRAACCDASTKELRVRGIKASSSPLVDILPARRRAPPLLHPLRL